MEDLFALQSEIITGIARSLEAELTLEEEQRVAGAPTEDLGAYRLYVRGRRLMAPAIPIRSAEPGATSNALSSKTQAMPSSGRALTGALIENGKYETALAEARRLQSMYPEWKEVGLVLESNARVHLKRWTKIRELVG